MSRGLLVAFDGVDGAGKTTQAERLAAALKRDGRRVRVLREPGGTALGEQLRAVLLAADGQADEPLVQACLFMASRRQLVVEAIRPALAQGDTVFLDRSFLSTWVYQGVVGGVELELLEALARAAHGDAWPDQVLLLDLSAEEADGRRAGRGAADDSFEAHGFDYLVHIAQAYRDMAARLPELVTSIPAGGDPDDVAARCRAAFDEVAAR